MGYPLSFKLATNAREGQHAIVEEGITMHYAAARICYHRLKLLRMRPKISTGHVGGERGGGEVRSKAKVMLMEERGGGGVPIGRD